MSTFKANPPTRRGALGALCALSGLLTLSLAGCGREPAATSGAPAGAGQPAVEKPIQQRQLWITNAYGNDVHIYEVGTWKLLNHIVVGSHPHGISAKADGTEVAISLEVPTGEMVWIDTRTGQVTSRLEIGGRPNAHEGTPDGKWLYVPNRSGGHWWVIDGEGKRVVRTIETGGGPHNTRISSDGKRMYLSPQGPPRVVTVVDIAADHKVIGTLPFSEALRPSAISSDETRFFQNVNGLIGFEVVDIPSRKIIQRVSHGIESKFPEDPDSRSHGLEVRPDQKEVWSSYLKGGVVYVHDMTKPDYPEIARIRMPGHVYWIRFNPDSQYGYVSLPNTSKVAVVDTRTRRIVTLLKAGDTPKRTLVVDVPLS
jgi:DNA-binding beta-propeller fold protein YncE